MTLRALLMLSLLACVGSTAAQTQTPHVCGAGPGPNEVQAGVQPGGPGIAPTPLCYWKPGAQQQSQPSGYWEKTWGAIVNSETGGALGTAVGASSKSQAEQLALADCQAKGGGGCNVALTYHNQCAVMIIGEKSYNMYSAGSIEQATADGMQDCKAKQSSCRVYYSACTEPIFHKY